MTIHLTPLPQDGPAVSSTTDLRSAAPASAAIHIFIGSAIVIVGLAVAMFVGVQLALPPLVAVAAGLAFAIGAGALHVRLARPSAERKVKAKVSRRTPSLDAARPMPPVLDTPSFDAHHTLPIDAMQPGVPAKSDALSSTVEPSDLALALLASLNASVEAKAASQPGPDAWTWAIAAQLESQAPAAPASSAPVHIPAPAALPHAEEAETEFQRVERLVKRLADNVNQLQAMRQGQPEAHRDGEQLALFDEAGDPSLQLEASINALRRANASHAIADAAPAAEAAPLAPALTPLPDTPHDMTWTKPASVRDPHADSQRSDILSALNTQRIDVYLEPILDLADQRPQHYEVSIALRTYGGHAIDLTHAANDLSGTGLLPLIDQARIAHAANVARRLADRGKTGAVFAELNGETLDDGGFKETFANDTISVGAFPGQLVLTLPQVHVATFTTADWHTLARLREAGFGFALSDVTSLDMDFPRLRDAGFGFARLDAETFLIGLPTSGGVVPPADICRHLASSGLMLIVGGIIEDHQLARIFGFGVLFGQGRLFGGPRPMKPEAHAAPQLSYQAPHASPAE